MSAVFFRSHTSRAVADESRIYICLISWTEKLGRNEVAGYREGGGIPSAPTERVRERENYRYRRGELVNGETAVAACGRRVNSIN